MKAVLFWILMIYPILSVFSTDSITLNISQADSIFINQNLTLLAYRFRIEEERSNIIQAKLYSNPSLYTEQSAYNKHKKQFYDVGQGGEYIISIEKAFLSAGKRNKRIELARSQVSVSEYEFYDLLRSLRLELRKSFYTIYFNSFIIITYNRQLEMLEEIIDAFEIQYTKGNVNLKELMRLKAAFFKLNNDRSEIFNQTLDEQRYVQTLLATNSFIKPVFPETEIKSHKMKFFDRDSLVALAFTNRYDLLSIQEQIRSAEINLQLQRRIAIPDPVIGMNYDKAGSYINDYAGLSLKFDLPVFNRNQGNIRMAENQVRRLQALSENKILDIRNEIHATMQKISLIENDMKIIDNRFKSDYELLNRGIIENFQKRNISLIEFIDFFESYNTSILEHNRLKRMRYQAYEELNYIVGKDVYELK